MEFNVFERDIEDNLSVTQSIIQGELKYREENKRVNKSIHASGFTECPRMILYGLYDTEPAFEEFNFHNEQAADTGDAIHGMVQKELLNSGIVVRLPYFHERREKQYLVPRLRDRGVTKPAIEVNLNSWSLPFTIEQLKIYRSLGYSDIDPTILHDLKRYMIGVRSDSYVRLPGLIGDVPLEIKTCDDKYWELTEEEQGELTKKQLERYKRQQKTMSKKWMKYMYQLQIQIHFSRDHETGERPEYGMIYLVNRGDTSKRKERVVQYNPEFIKAWLPDLLKTKRAFENGQLRRGRPGDDCAFCVYNLPDNSRTGSTVCDEPERKSRYMNWAKIKSDSKKRREQEEAFVEALSYNP